eukprot:NODE_224_length_13912_cov_0.116604.p3 type:complete len:349 gc:universal NODE_224_length_13912_cov_0.116604:7077-6031(-)
MVTIPPDTELPSNALPNYDLKEILGKGAFGQIYRATQNHDEYAVKIEPPSTKKQVLKVETQILKKLQDMNSPYFLKLIGYGNFEYNGKYYQYMVMNLVGQNLSDIRKKQPTQKFSLPTCSLLLKEMLLAIRDFHSAGYVHRDIKPSNFAVDRYRQSPRSRIILLDFGLARRLIKSDGTIKTPRSDAGFRGTARYASIQAHESKDLSRIDDLWSLFYVMVEFMKGQLPWRKEKDKEKIGEMKKVLTSSQLLLGLPEQTLLLLKYLRTLDYFSEPNYEYITSLFDSMFLDTNESADITWDWEKEMLETNSMMTTEGLRGVSEFPAERDDLPEVISTNLEERSRNRDIATE